MSSSTVFRVSNDTSNEVKKKTRDQSSARLTWPQTHVRFENDHSSTPLKNTIDDGGIMSTRDLAPSVTELTEETAFELGLHLLPASMASYLLRRAKQGSCPPLPILRLLGLCIPVETDKTFP